MRRILITVGIFATILLVWQVTEDAVNAERIANGDTTLEIFFPTPVTIGSTFIEDGQLILKHLSHTLARAFAGLLLGISLAWSFAFLFLQFPHFRSTVMPINLAINAFPIIGFAPVIILAFGQGSSLSICLISMLICYFPVLIALDHAFSRVDSDTVDVLRVFNATKLQTFFMLYAPSAIPGFVSSLRLAIPASIIGATIGEWLGVRTGIGHLVTMSLYQLNPSLLYASLLSVTMVSVLCVSLLIIVETKFIRWQ